MQNQDLTRALAPLSDRPKRLALSQNGGDCGGLNAAYQSIVLTAHMAGWEVVGIKRGTQGLYENTFTVLRPEDVKGWEMLPGTKLLSTRETFKDKPDAPEKMVANFLAMKCSAWTRKSVAMAAWQRPGKSHRKFRKNNLSRSPVFPRQSITISA